MDQSQLQQVEKLCEALYAGTNSAQRQEAQQQLLTLQSSVDFIPQCQFILDHSNQAYAHIVSLSSLESLTTSFWLSFSPPQKISLLSYIFNYLATRAPSLPDFVISQACKIAARIVKLGWFDHAEFREVVEGAGGGGSGGAGKGWVGNMLDSPHVEVQYVGVRALGALVDEMNTPISGKTLTSHRKTAVSFRDQTLLGVFSLGLNMLKLIYMQLQSLVSATNPPGVSHPYPLVNPPSQGVGGQDKLVKMLGQVLHVVNLTLAFDFIGTNPEESVEDVGTLQVPSAWRPLIQEPSTLQIFFDLYKHSLPPLSNTAMEIIVSLSSVRRSLFPSETERTTFLHLLLSNLLDILPPKSGAVGGRGVAGGVGLRHVENFHEVCRVLGRLKASYQLSELCKLSNFLDFLEVSGEFTLTSLSSPSFSPPSLHYLLALWGRLVAALPYLRGGIGEGGGSGEALTGVEGKVAGVLKMITVQVVQRYISAMLETVEQNVEGGDGDDPLDDEGGIREQMDRLPPLVRLQYDTVGNFLLQQFEQSLVLYACCTFRLYNLPPSSSHPYPLLSPLLQNAAGVYNEVCALPARLIIPRMIVLEGRLTWLVTIVAALVEGGGSLDQKRNAPADLLYDGRLSRCVLQLIYTLDLPYGELLGVGANKPHPPSSPPTDLIYREKMYKSLVGFVRSFQKAYCFDSVGNASSMAGLYGSTSYGTYMSPPPKVPNGNTPHPLLSMVLNDASMKEGGGGDGGGE
eukprot:gene29111-35131_t